MIPLHILPLSLKEALSYPKEDYISQLRELLCQTSNKQDVVFTSDGRNAIYLALKVMGLKNNDEVLIPGYACYAVREAVNQICTPVYVDVRRDTLNIDPNDIERKITKRTRAILVAHLYGNPCDMTSIQALAKAHNLILIEDVAQALGGKYNNEVLGRFGDFTMFSFRFTKNIGAFRGGALLANNNMELSLKPGKAWRALPGVFFSLFALEQIKRMPAMLYAPVRKNILVPLFTRNSAKVHISNESLSNYQCYLLYKQMAKMQSIIKKRRDNAEYYTKHLRDSVITPQETEGGEHTFYRYTIQTDKRDRLYDYLLSHGIEVDKMYDYFLSPENTCPNSKIASERSLNIPVHQDLSSAEMQKVVKAIYKFKQTRYTWF